MFGLFSSHLSRFLPILFGAFLIACSGGVEDTRVDQGNREGILHMGNGTEPQGLDPHIVTGVPEHHILQALFEGLVLKNPYTLEIEPGVAESWDISEDGRTYIFHLREDALWSNGQPVTAEDFYWSWERVLNPALGSQYAYMLFSVVGAEAYNTGELDDFSQVGARVVDEHTFEVTLTEPTPYFLQVLDHYSTFPVNKDNVLAFGSATDQLSQWAREGNIVTNGPFTLNEWRINSHLSVSKFEDYWGTEQVQLNGIVFYPTENLVTEERMFRDGQIHKTNDIPLDKIPVYQQDNPELIYVEPYLGTYFYNINLTREPLDDVRVRMALNLAVDRELLAETVMLGIVDPAYAIVPPDTLGYDPVQLFDYNPERARELLAEAGYPGGEGFPAFEILYNTQESHRKIAVAIQQMWMSELNIPVTIVNQEWKVYLDSQNNMDYDVVRRGWIGDYIDPNNFLDLFLTGGGNNKTAFSDARYDEIITQLAPATPERDERYALFEEAETILMEAVPIIPLYTYKNKSLRHPNLKGMPTNIQDYFNYRYVWLEGEQAN